MGVKEECGVIACVLKTKTIPISSVIYNLLSELQHRGQTSAGMTIFSPDFQNRLRSLKSVGKVADLFRVWDKTYFKSVMNDYCGNAGIGHVRYATSDVKDDMVLSLEEAQPFFRRHGHPWKRFAVAFNGHLTNYESLREKLIGRGYILDTFVDTEVLMHLISLSLKNYSEDCPSSFSKVFEEVIDQIDGSFCFSFMNALGDVVVARDKLGFRPLVIGENENMICVASESKALTKLGIVNFRDVEPGEIILIKDDKIQSISLKNCGRRAHCHFEYVYFSHTCSINDKILVNDVRTRLGRILGCEEKLKHRFVEEDWVVIPVPSTSIPSANSYSQETRVPIEFSLLKSDGGRGFINSCSMRKIIMDSKYNLVPNSVIGKKVILVDDSIVRGETSKRVIKLIRDAGAKEVHLRITELPIRFPCCYGVDFHSFDELIVGGFEGTLEEAEEFVAKEIGADSLGYVSMEGLKDALGGGEDKFCFACLNGKYPTLAGDEFLKKKLELRDKIT
ncbi:amidophosphoribosyltransferase [Candidatus Pacearchaeota archaeon]|nr:amidophosphoribosyltransferase [Candidatus Pacearchaeota archaeon]